VVLVVPNDRRQARQGCDREEREERRGSPAILSPGASAHNREEKPQRLHHERALTPLHALAAVIPAFRTAALRGLDRLTVAAERTWRGLTSCSHARLCA
jgi:hypothetical protein